MWSYTLQPAGHVASLHVSNLIQAANRDGLWATIAHYIIMPDNRYMARAADHAHTHSYTHSPLAIMTAALEPFRPFSAELHVIRRLNSSLYGAGGRARPGRANSPFSRFHPPAEQVTVAPVRDDIPLLDPCCGQLCAGAEVDLGVKGRQKFIDFHHVASALWVPPGLRERPQTASNYSGVCEDLRQDKAWNSRKIPDAVLRAKLNGN